MKTYSLKPSDVTRTWYLVDASELPLGRLSSKIANLLTGKGKASFSPHIDGGDYVVVVNADNLKVTGKKTDDKLYFHHTGYPGGIKQRTLGEQVERDSTKVIVDAVRGMIPANKLRDGRLARLKVYAGAEHANAAQKPKKINLGDVK